MSLLRIANNNSKRISLGDDGDYIEVIADISKKTFNDLMLAMPDVPEGEKLSIPQALSFSQELFRVFVSGWSLPVPVTLESYESLTREGADAVDTAVAEHFASLTPSDKESQKSEGPSKKPR